MFPELDLRTIVLHWTAGDDATSYPAYHFVVTTAGDDLVVHASTPLSWNARDVRVGDAPYAAHVAGRNSHAIGVALAAMRDARPDDFGAFPLSEAGIDALCAVAARLAAAYGIPVVPDRVFTHAEAAIADGYFGAGPDERWDIARLAPADGPVTEGEARAVGEALRARIVAVRG